ncbi:hypothetical protein LJC00_02715 [Dysgonomonas sp. OttesenSCG-928-M03]|nr:hypothetical protein [Dysgonomonas sp. OttesenSCG-928-M03]
MKLIACIITSLIALSLFFSCDNNDHFSTDSNMRLAFSSDTIRFDTVFTSLGTATKRLKIYNRNSDALTINNVELMNAAKTGFRMNVDGFSGNSVGNVDILAKDSIYVFIEATIDPLNQNNPLFISDSIRFQFNGVTQYVRLEAIGQDVILWKGKKIEKDTTLTAEKPFLIYDSLYVKEGVTLNIEKNSHFYFHSNASFSIAGNVNAKGTIQEPVVFRGDRTDNIFESPKLSYDRVPGQWYGVKLAPKSYNNHFENVRIRNSVYGVLCLPSDTAQTKISLMNTTIQNTTKDIISAVNAKIDAQNSLFANSGTYTINIIGGSYNFLHCTIANYMAYNGTTRRGTMLISNSGTDTSGKSQSAALGTCRFINTIIAGAGNNKDEIKLNSTGSLAFNYIFINSLLKVPGTDDQYFINTVWNEDPGFRYIYKTGDAQVNPNLYYYYDFSIGENSKAINKASRQYAAKLPNDITGVSRRNDDGPDIGCFEWKK